MRTRSLAPPAGRRSHVCVCQPKTKTKTFLRRKKPPESAASAGLPLVGLGARVLVVSATNDPDQVARAIERGATDVIDKCVPFHELLDRALAVARGVVTMATEDRRRLLREARERDAVRATQLAPFARLSHREQDVLRALAQGDNVSVIASTNVVSEATVRSQVRSILTPTA